MKSAVTTVVSAADAAGRFPSMSDFESVKGSFDRAKARLEAAEKLASCLDKFTNLAVDAVYQNGSYEQSNKDKCVRDIHHLTCVQCGETSKMEGCPVKDIQTPKKNPEKFQLLFHTLEYFGLCQNCYQAQN